MIEKVKAHIEALEKRIPKNKEELESLKRDFLGKKGIIPQLFADFKNVPGDQKKEFGQVVNQLKQLAEERYQEFRKQIEGQARRPSLGDLTRPGPDLPMGALHPLTIVRNEISDIFTRIGFSIEEGPEIEDDWHNFSALNFPEEHPARDMQDTFFVQESPDFALRTHTSSVQVRVMESGRIPIRSIMPGRVYRNEAISPRAHCMFHQVEGLHIDKGVSFADMKKTLLYFAESFFGKGTRIRLRPSYFPFTEPSAEMDVWWGLESEADHRITKGTGWLEIMGAGMVDPNVLESCGIDPGEYSGYAFGMGIERIAMNRFGVTDLRMFFENDIRMLEQFKGAR
ncbi:MAG: phenylalanine--tRNA ligase subunit alpha [Bacteroidota bacterium]|nr:phenylalanine--tRNA ligase subunit alpha [Bacteroidota bacterium]